MELMAIGGFCRILANKLSHQDAIVFNKQVCSTPKIQAILQIFSGLSDRKFVHAKQTHGPFPSAGIVWIFLYCETIR